MGECVCVFLFVCERKKERTSVKHPHILQSSQDFSEIQNQIGTYAEGLLMMNAFFPESLLLTLFQMMFYQSCLRHGMNSCLNFILHWR